MGTRMIEYNLTCDLDLENEIRTLQNKKKEYLKSCELIETEIIGIKEELRRRKLSQKKD